MQSYRSANTASGVVDESFEKSTNKGETRRKGEETDTVGEEAKESVANDEDGVVDVIGATVAVFADIRILARIEGSDTVAVRRRDALE